MRAECIEVSNPGQIRRSSSADAHPAPEGDVVLDVGSSSARRRVVEGSTLVALAVDLDVVVAGNTLPCACGVPRRVDEILTVDGLAREVVVPFDDDRFVTLGEYDAVPLQASAHAGLGLELLTGAALGSIAGSTGRVSVEDESDSVGFFHILVISGSYRRGPYL